MLSVLKNNSIKIIGENNPMKNPVVIKKHLESVNTKEYKEIISNDSIKKWENPEYREQIIQHVKKRWKIQNIKQI